MQIGLWFGHKVQDCATANSHGRFTRQLKRMCFKITCSKNSYDKSTMQLGRVRATLILFLYTLYAITL